MEIIIKFIFGVTVVAFAMNFFAITGYLMIKLRNFYYRKYRKDVLSVLCLDNNITYSDYIFIGLFVIGVMLFLFGSVYMTCQLGNYLYSLI